MPFLEEKMDKSTQLNDIKTAIQTILSGGQSVTDTSGFINTI